MTGIKVLEKRVGIVQVRERVIRPLCHTAVPSRSNNVSI